MDRQVIEKLQEYFSTQPIMKAWLFGSYARGEQSLDSDVDIMVSYDDKARITLFTIGGIYMDLSKILGRKIDLVEEGTLKPYVVENVNRDKILIYERGK